MNNRLSYIAISRYIFDIDLESLSGEDLGISESVSDRRVETVRQLLTLKLLREAIRAENPDDRVMADFAEMVLPNLHHKSLRCPEMDYLV